jgi:hypothetical protein
MSIIENNVYIDTIKGFLDNIITSYEERKIAKKNSTRFNQFAFCTIGKHLTLPNPLEF